MERAELKCFPLEVTERVVCSSYNDARAIEIGIFRGDHALRPDRYTSWVEFNLAHAFPVVASDGLALHPQVIANSYRSLFSKVFNLGHVIRSYDPEAHARDRIVGSIFAVEFPTTPMGGWKVQARRSAAPGIRAVACMHKQAEGVDRILGQHQSGRKHWTVSRENDYYLEDSGFLIKGPSDADELHPWAKSTPKDLSDLGYVYIPCVESPTELLQCYSPEQGKIRRKYNGHEVVLLLGGLNGSVQFKGTGLTPLGKEAEAEIQQMLASGASVDALEEALGEDDLATSLSRPLKKFGDSLIGALRP